MMKKKSLFKLSLGPHHNPGDPHKIWFQVAGLPGPPAPYPPSVADSPGSGAPIADSASQDESDSNSSKLDPVDLIRSQL